MTLQTGRLEDTKIKGQMVLYTEVKWHSVQRSDNTKHWG